MRLHNFAIKLICAAALLTTLAVSRPAAANPGLRLGVTSQPDTLFLGFQYDALISRGRSLAFVFQPAIDVGFNDNLFMIRGTGHFAFWIPVGRRVYFYPLIGVSGTYYNYKDPGGDGTGIGMDLGFGMRINQFGFEFWGSFRDAPDLTFAFSISF